MSSTNTLTPGFYYKEDSTYVARVINKERWEWLNRDSYSWKTNPYHYSYAKNCGCLELIEWRD